MKRRFKRLLIICLILPIIGMIIYGLINYRVLSFSKDYIITVEDAEKSEAALVLGALVYSSGRVSPILADRLDFGIELYHKNKVDKLLLSGDHGRKHYDEVNAMKNYVLDNDIPEKDIFMDHAGFNTYDSLYRARDVFKAKKIIIVTQEYHLPRAIYIARKLGLDAYGVAADKHFYPKIEMYKFRESLARCKDFIYVNLLKPKPKYLGEPIDISGDGLRTND